jgi:hypothetical protein
MADLLEHHRHLSIARRLLRSKPWFESLATTVLVDPFKKKHVEG